MLYEVITEYIGIDVSKDKFDCLWLRDVSTGKVKTKVFKNNQLGYQTAIDWLVNNTRVEPSAIFITLEATGVYHEGLAYHLYDAGFKVSVV